MAQCGGSQYLSHYDHWCAGLDYGAWGRAFLAIIK